MDHLLKLYSVLKTPSIDVDDLKGSNLHRFMDTSLASAEKITKEPELKSKATDALFELLSTQDTFDALHTMFESAANACLIDKERERIYWLQTCVSAVVQYALEPKKEHELKSRSMPRKIKKTSYDDDAYVLSEEEAAVPIKKTSRKKKQVKELDIPRKSSPRKSKKKQEEEEESWDEDESEDDFEPSEDDDEAIVPEKKTRPKTSKKKSDDSQTSARRRKPLKEATLPIIEDGAGSRAIAKYFLDFDEKEGHEEALASGYFARSFFFPSKDSFNAFISALNSAKKTIDICVFAFTDDHVVATLTAAKDRGVKIKIITDNQQAAGKGADVKNLYESHGIPFRTDKTNGYMHNKFAIIDSATLINGSFNWSKGARFKNKENIIITNIPLCIKEFQKEFDSLWEEFE